MSIDYKLQIDLYVFFKALIISPYKFSKVCKTRLFRTPIR